MSSAEASRAGSGRALASVFAAVLLGALLLGASGVDLPRIELDGQGRLWLDRLPPILEDDKVDGQLHNGLTTVLLISVDSGAAAGAAARVDIRYELWDEVFLVAVRGPESRSGSRSEPGEPLRLADTAELVRWWGDLRLAGGTVPRGVRAEALRPATVRIEVVPFSQAEELDTQRWFEESVQRAERQSETDGEEVSGGAGLERVLTTLMATSIRRRPVISYRWRVPIEPEDTG